MKQHLMPLALRICKALLLGMLTGAGLAPFGAWAELPRTIHIIVPFPPGGPIDLSARILAESMRAQTGIAVIVENRPSGGGNIAAVTVKQAAPNGANLLLATSGMLTVSPHLYRNLPYDAAVDFVPVTTVSYIAVALVMGGGVPVRNLTGFVELARTTRPPLAFSSTGTGSAIHGYLELFKDAAKIDLLHVPYKGAAASFAGVMSGQIAGTFVVLANALPQMRSGQVKVLGLVGTKRSELAPDVPTLEEQGYAGLDMLSWTGVMVRRGTRPEIVSELANAAASALAPDAVKAKLLAGGLTHWVLPAEEFARIITRESERWEKLIAEKKIRVE
ncbi:MAG: tripartite tricarboxylate transporter substrate binding protein [Betaproteobacteria bacterium]|nr:tripartite tricarboxylate transporter substrate binding protein [Betaproteobacteria bacterium]